MLFECVENGDYTALLQTNLLTLTLTNNDTNKINIYPEQGLLNQ
jgi:hypothetical protein